MVRTEIRHGEPFKNSHLERTSPACPPLEIIRMPKGSKAIRLINRYEAIDALRQALDIAKTLKPSDRKYYEDHQANKLLDIAAAQAEIGEDPISTVKIATGLKIDSMDVLIHARASRIAAYVGDEKLALKLAEKASEHEGGWPFRNVANVLAEKGRDPKLFLDKAAELADSYQLGQEEFAGLRTDNFAETAVNMHKHGRDPQPWLEKAHRTLQQAGKRKSYAYNGLANAYAAIGEYAKANL